MYQVEVKGIPVRYKDKTYAAGDAFLIEENHLNLMKDFVEVKEEAKEAADLDKLKKSELQKLLEEKEIEYNKNATKEELLELLK